MKPKRIRTLTELQEERINLKIRIAATRKELLSSATETATAGRKFLFKKVMLPAGAAGIGIAVTRNILDKFVESRTSNEKTSHGAGHWSLELLLMGLPVLQQLLSKALEGLEEDDEQESEALHASSTHEKGQHYYWLQTLLPIGIAWLRHFIQSKIYEEDEQEVYS